MLGFFGDSVKLKNMDFSDSIRSGEHWHQFFCVINTSDSPPFYLKHLTFLGLGDPHLLITGRETYWYQCLLKNNFPFITNCDNCDIDIIAKLLENTKLSD
jgi:hypothetical protein